VVGRGGRQDDQRVQGDDTGWYVGWRRGSERAAPVKRLIGIVAESTEVVEKEVVPVGIVVLLDLLGKVDPDVE
jgi:hypothetical protein